MTDAAEIIRGAIAQTKTDILEVQQAADIIAEGLMALQDIPGSRFAFKQTGRDNSTTISFSVKSNRPSLTEDMYITLADESISLSSRIFEKTRTFSNDASGVLDALREAARYAFSEGLIPKDQETKQGRLTPAETAIQEGIARAKTEMAAKEAATKAERDAALARDAGRNFESEVDKTLMSGLRFLRKLSGLRIEFNVAAVKPGSKDLTITTNIPSEEKDNKVRIYIYPDNIFVHTGKSMWPNAQKNNRGGSRAVLKELTRSAVLHGLIPAQP